MPVWKEFYCKSCNGEVTLPKIYQRSWCPASFNYAIAAGERRELHVPHTALLPSASGMEVGIGGG